jgi:hypothetical protein
MAIFFTASPVKDAPVLDYTGKPVVNQAKHFVVINYDVGTADHHKPERSLQYCYE